MSTATSSRPGRGLHTAEELEDLPDRKGYELLDGEFVERNVSVESSDVASQISMLLRQYVKRGDLGRVLDSSIGMQIFADRPRHVPRPDVAYISFDRLPKDAPSTGFLLVAPELIVEVISPGDKALEIERKVGEYLDAGVEQVWVVYPDTKRVHVFQVDGPNPIREAGETIDGGGSLAGFSVEVEQFFSS